MFSDLNCYVAAEKSLPWHKEGMRGNKGWDRWDCFFKLAVPAYSGLK